TALRLAAARHLDLIDGWQGYGYPNDLLIQLCRRGFRVSEVPVRPVYGIEKSGLRSWHILTISWVILRRSLLEILPQRSQRAAVRLNQSFHESH
ncbi:MAG: hypothetical protein MK135_17315, partial [Polyangiaceae bacterium]|nr:hypothetical protein [Polyangiaceae bacterium]